MFSTLMLAVAGGLAAGNATAPDWQADYATALTQATRLQKPVAILMTAGEAGQALTPQAAAAMASHFVCVHADVTTAEGRELAGRFGLTEGLVISDRDAKLQALRHAGKVSGEAVALYAEQYAAPVNVTRTDYLGDAAVPATAAAPVMQSAPVMQAPMMQSAPVYQSAPMYQSAPVFQSYPGVSRGGCPNGNCGR